MLLGLHLFVGTSELPNFRVVVVAVVVVVVAVVAVVV